MQKFNVGDKVEVVKCKWGSEPCVKVGYVKENPRTGVLFAAKDLEDTSGCEFEIAKLVSSANENMQYIVRYTDKDQEDQTEWDLDTKEEVLEFIEDEEDDIDWDYDVEVLEVSKTFTVEKASKYKLVEE